MLALSEPPCQLGNMQPKECVKYFPLNIRLQYLPDLGYVTFYLAAIGPSGEKKKYNF